MIASKMFLASPAMDDQILPGSCVFSTSSTYMVQTILGQGTFGKVAKCTRITDNKTVAIKMIKNEGYNIQSATLEVNALRKLKNLDSDKCNLVKWYQDFIHGGHICLMFEHLDKSLLDFLKERYFRPLPLKAIRSITQQIATALVHLKSVGIIHADLKLENVMLVNHEQEPYRVKVIDFGLARNVSEARVGSNIQTCPYRSPEIILGLPFTEAIDMWSLGCLAATLYLGSLLYPGMGEYEMMRYIVETQGQPPDFMLNYGTKTNFFFRRHRNFTSSFWKLKTPELFFQETGIVSTDRRRVKLRSLDDLLNIRSLKTQNSADKVAEIHDLVAFVQLLKGMLQLDAARRMTPRQVLEHQFITLDHNTGMNHRSSQTTSSVQPKHVHTHQSSSTKTTTSVMSGVKRGHDEEDGNMNRTYEPKKFKAAISDNHHGRGQAFANFTEACPNSRRPPADPLQSISICHIDPVVKGRMTDGEAVDQSKRKIIHRKDSNNDETSQKRMKKDPTEDSSHRCTQALHTQPDLRGSQTDDHHHTATEKHSSPGNKRKATDSESVCHSRKRSSEQLEEGKARKKFASGRRQAALPRKPVACLTEAARLQPTDIYYLQPVLSDNLFVARFFAIKKQN